MTGDRRAVVLLSGGLDSSTTLAIALHEGFECYGLTFHYGQRHSQEIQAAKRVAAGLGLTHHLFLSTDLGLLGGSALTDASIDVPAYDPVGDSIPPTYVPARNTVFLAYALAYAETCGAGHVFIGVNAVDYSGYPDCRPEYVEAFQAMANLATKAAVEGNPVKITAPLLHMTKPEISRAGLAVGADYSLTHSCYDPEADGRACGLCDACHIRADGFAAAGMADPCTG